MKDSSLKCAVGAGAKTIAFFAAIIGSMASFFYISFVRTLVVISLGIVLLLIAYVIWDEFYEKCKINKTLNRKGCKSG